MLHDLDVHRLELEMQNRELREAQEQLEESRSRLADLYDFAPVVYVTLDPMGKILEANLTAAAMFGIERGNLIGKFVTTLVAPPDRGVLRYVHPALLRRAHPRRDRAALRRTRPPGGDRAGGERAVHRGGRGGYRMQDDAHRHHGAHAGPGTAAAPGAGGQQARVVVRLPRDARGGRATRRPDAGGHLHRRPVGRGRPGRQARGCLCQRRRRRPARTFRRARRVRTKDVRWVG